MSANDHSPLTVLGNEASALIRAEVRAMEQRTRLEQAVAQMVVANGYSVDEVSAASGLTVPQIREILGRPEHLHKAVLTAAA